MPCISFHKSHDVVVVVCHMQETRHPWSEARSRALRHRSAKLSFLHARNGHVVSSNQNLQSAALQGGS